MSVLHTLDIPPVIMCMLISKKLWRRKTD